MGMVLLLLLLPLLRWRRCLMCRRWGRAERTSGHLCPLCPAFSRCHSSASALASASPAHPSESLAQPPRIASLLTLPRGQLNLNMAPASRLQISFVGDDGRTEQLCSISCNSSEVDSIIIEEIVADTSGRSFLVKVSESQVFYYWLSEKSLSHGLHLLGKMKDVLRRRPTLSELTGISRSRLDSLGSHLQACLVSPKVLAVAQSIHSETTASTSTFTTTSSENARSPRPHHHRTFTSTSTHGSSSLSSSSRGASLSPRGNTSFKDNSSSLSSVRTVGGIRDNKLKGRHVSPLVIPSLPFNSPPATQHSLLPSFHSEAVASLSAGLPPEFSPFNPLTFQFPIPPSDCASSMSMDNQPLFKPQYCWCPMGPSRVPSSALPPLTLPLPPPPPPPPPSSLSLSTTASSDCTKVLLDPLVHLPLPVSSLVIPPLPGSSQFPAFTGLMSDPIVHMPAVMDIRSAGQAYLVSAGPAISTAIPPLPLVVPTTESVAEKNARETLMRLLDSAPMPNPIHAVAFSMDVFSSVNSTALKEDMSCQASEREENEQEQEVCRVDNIKWDE
ncbi:flocculation protein isoform X2 [Carex rostrata]